jgi:hypothetical protein
MSTDDRETFPDIELGARLRCPECGSEAVVTKLGDGPRVSCHGPLEVISGAGGDPRNAR